MTKSTGFTLIELLVTITVMVMLLTFSVVLLRNNQASARDEERKTDVAVIAQQLENYYSSGTDGANATGSYPPTQTVDTESEVKDVLRDLDPKALYAPDATSMSFAVATSASTPSPALNSYVYQPLTAAGAICQTAGTECVKFAIYYTLETDAALQKVKSRNQ